MGVHGVAKCMKYLLLVFNLFFFLLGCTLIGIGVWGEVTLDDYVHLTDVNFLTGPRIIIAVGVGIAIISFLGCCGAYKENKCMLSLYLTLLIILLALEVAAAVLAFQNRDEMKTQIEKDIKKSIQEYPHKNKKPMDDMQEKLECCGAQSYKDWELNTDYNTTAVPDSCCKTAGQDCGKGRNTDKIYTEGCYKKFQDLVERNLTPTAALAITMFLIQVFGIIFAIVILCKID